MNNGKISIPKHVVVREGVKRLCVKTSWLNDLCRRRKLQSLLAESIELSVAQEGVWLIFPSVINPAGHRVEGSFSDYINITKTDETNEEGNQTMNEELDVITLLQLEHGVHIYEVTYFEGNNNNTYCFKSTTKITKDSLAVVSDSSGKSYKIVRVGNEVTNVFEPVPGIVYKWLLFSLPVDETYLKEANNFDNKARRKLALGGAIAQAKALGKHLTEEDFFPNNNMLEIEE